MHALSDGAFLRTIAHPDIANQAEGLGGLCVSADGDSCVLADYFGHCLREFRIADGALIRKLAKLTTNPHLVSGNLASSVCAFA